MSVVTPSTPSPDLGPGTPPAAASPAASAPALKPAPAADPSAPTVHVDNYIEMKADPEKATLLIKSSAIKDAVPILKEDIVKKINAMKITDGVDWAVIDRVLAGKLFDKTHIVAVATPARDSRDGYLEEMIKVDPDTHPVLGKDGKADYRNVDNIHQVKKGDVLVVRHPPTLGEPGRDIFGNPLPAKPAKDVQFKPGANTSITTDGLKLVADTGGFVFHQGGVLSVGVEYVLQGDVNFKTGNLHYNGNILVTGNVADGFTVEAVGNVTIEGSVEGAEIRSKEGSVWIKLGVFGHGKSVVTAKADIRLLAAQDARLECEGTLTVDKGLRNCQVIAASVKADSQGCTVLGGAIKCYSEANLAVMGGEGCRTEVHIVDKMAEAARKQIAEIEKHKSALGGKLELVEKKLKGMKAMAQKLGTAISPRSLAQLKEELGIYGELKKAVDTLEAEKNKLTESLNSVARHVGKLIIREKVVWGGYLELYGHIRELVPEDAPKEWHWGADGMASRSLTPAAVPSENPPAAA